MRASKIQCQYADLNNAAQQFTRQSEGTQQLLRTVQTCLQQLQGGAWRGRGASAFYAELEREVLPSVQRLIGALREASSATQRIGQTLEQAEREAGALFVGGAGDAENIVSDSIVNIGDGGKYVLAGYAKPNLQGGVNQGGDDRDKNGDGIPDTAGDRSATYTDWSEMLAGADSVRRGIKFYMAAALVTDLLAGASGQFNVLVFLSATPTIPFAGIISMAIQEALGVRAHDVAQSVADAQAFNNFIGEGLFRLNDRIHNLVQNGKFEINGTDLLISPYQGYGGVDILSYLENGYSVNAAGALIDPNGNPVIENGISVQVKTVSSGLEWDIAMVMHEQEHVGTLLLASTLTRDQITRGIEGNNYLLNMNDAFRDPFIAEVGRTVFGADFTAVNWAETALSNAGISLTSNGDLNFEEIDHRIAIGLAIVFQQHGYSESDYVAYVQQVVSQNQQNLGASILYTPDGTQPAPPSN